MDLREKIKEHIGKAAIIFTENGFRYECILKQIGTNFVVIFDTKKGYEKIIQLDSIKEADLL